jgi:5-formyltetrahydrofolate cyclo-ligase
VNERTHLAWEGEEEDAHAARQAAGQLRELRAHQRGEAISVGNEFSEIRVVKVETRNGARLLIEAPKSGQWVALCPLELEALTWQNTATFSAMIGNPFGPLVSVEEES